MKILQFFLFLVLPIYLHISHINAHGISCVKDMYLGMSDYRIPDESITASEEWPGGHHPARAARLDANLGAGKGWCANGVNYEKEFLLMTVSKDRWIQVDLKYPTMVSGITVHCPGWAMERLGDFSVEYGFYSDQMLNFLRSDNGTVIKVFPGCNGNTPVTYRWDPTIMSVIRLHVQGQNRSEIFNVCMTFELLGCPVYLREPYCLMINENNNKKPKYGYHYSPQGWESCAFGCTSKPECVGFYVNPKSCFTINQKKADYIKPAEIFKKCNP